jgi:hypothetical protein
MARFKGKTKFNWDKPALKRLVGEAAAKALQNAGMDCRRSVQRQMVGGSTPVGRSPRKKPVFWKVGERDGFNMVAMVYKVPRDDKVSSWAPMAFLRNDIQTDWDNSTKSVVIGPSAKPWLNQLHEFGGSVSVYFRPISQKPIGGWIGPNVRLPSKFERRVVDYAFVAGRRVRMGTTRLGAYVGYLSNDPVAGSTYIGTRSVKGRGYMEIGLQAMIHRIPKQFQDTIRSSGGSVGR